MDWYKQNRLAEDEELPPDLFTDEECAPYSPEAVKRAPETFPLRAPKIKEGLANKIDSYYNSSLQGTLSYLQGVVYRAIHDLGSATDCEISEATGVEKNVVIPRRTELLKLGMLRECGSKVNPRTGKKNLCFEINNKVN